MVIERTTDMDLIRIVMTDPDIYPHISDDGCVSRETFQPCQSSEVIYLSVCQGTGIFMLVPQNAVTFEVHTCLTRLLWGISVDCAKAGLRWMWDHTAAQRIVTSVPAYNGLALRLAQRSGMKEYGVNPRSFLKNGRLYDQHLLGISRGEN